MNVWYHVSLSWRVSYLGFTFGSLEFVVLVLRFEYPQIRVLVFRVWHLGSQNLEELDDLDYSIWVLG